MNEYNIEGELKFTADLRATQLAIVHRVLEEYAFELNEEFSGIQWDWDGALMGDEISQINAILSDVRAQLPEFGMTGRLLIQDAQSRWLLEIGEDGLAHRVELPDPSRITCPYCQRSFPASSHTVDS
jgi:hypothetical protein